MLDAVAGRSDIGAVNRALPALAAAALLVMLLEAAPGVSVMSVGVLGIGFVAWLVAGYQWVLTRGRAAAVGYLRRPQGSGRARAGPVVVSRN